MQFSEQTFFAFDAPSSAADLSLTLLNADSAVANTDFSFMAAHSNVNTAQTYQTPVFDTMFLQHLQDQMLFQSMQQQSAFSSPNISPVISTIDVPSAQFEIPSYHQFPCLNSTSPLFEERTLSNNSASSTPQLQFLGAYDMTPPTSPKLQPEGASTIKSRFRPNREQFDLLMALFQQNPFPIKTLRNKLAQDFECSEKQIRFWFQNRRQTLKTNGIHTCKPKTADSQALPLRSKKSGTSLVPLSRNSSYFFVEK
ncbi:UNVERIFIED_CONTAM: hypothetical protein HDU68_001754 [Siphonaria sp. JEL0065]|nr:hypothetical protein HDU68_001754 [Siphonaria sp. JEL0065]